GTILLYYDNDTNPTNKSVIATVPFTALSGSYLWDTRNVPRGTYYIYGQVTESAATSRIYSSGTVAINTRPLITITAPVSHAEPALGQKYTIRWTAANLDLLSGPGRVYLYRVRDVTFTDTARVDTGLAVGLPVGAYSYLWDTTGVDTGIYRIYGVLSDDSAFTDTDLSLGSVDVRPSKQPALMQITQPDITLGVIDGANDVIIYPSAPPPSINRNQALVAFKTSDRVRWYDTNFPFAWDYTNDANDANDDTIWVDADNNGVYNSSETILAGNPNIADGTGGVILTGLMPFSYKDNNANLAWNSTEPIVYERFDDGNRRLSFSNAKVDVVFNSVPAGGLAPIRTHLDFYLDTDNNPTNGFYLPDAIESDTVLAGASLSGSINYDFSQLAYLQHGIYYIAMKVTEDSGWYPPVYYYSPAPVTINSAPTIIITRPDEDTDIYSGSPLNITYFTGDPDSSAQFRIYVYDATNGDTFLITSGTLNSTYVLGSYLWDAAAVGTIFPRNRYLYIKGSITDNFWVDTSQALGRVRILTQRPSVILTAVPGSTAITLEWVDSTPVGETKEYLIYRQDLTTGDTSLIRDAIRNEANGLFPADIVLINALTNEYQYVDNDPNLVANHTYLYYVDVRIREGVNTYIRRSNAVQSVLRAFVNIPYNLELVGTTSPVELRWEWNNLIDTQGDPYGFVVERRGSLDTNWVSFPRIPSTGQAFGVYVDYSVGDTMILRDPTYVYRVRAYRQYLTGATGYSDYSETRSITLSTSTPIVPPFGSPGGGGGGVVGPLAAGISALLAWRKRRKKTIVILSRGCEGSRT
ncbi:MAG: hypothetical protein NTY10_00705, partial [Candidatus Omnitrophica bacterium]|nr:hypothetical protein [Candidatus Omnitrophota bacterium]